MAGSVVMCYCEVIEIYVDGKCQVYDGAIVIPVQHDYIYTKEENVSSYNVTVQDVNCDTSKHSYMNFTKNRFHIRPRGDVVLLKEAGKLEGQRFNNYCIFHHLDEYDQLTWTMKACVPIPSVPRCCPHGQAMKEGKCQAANTPDVLKPPISAKPFSDSIDWDNITGYQSPLKCDSEHHPPITIPLGQKQSHLVSLADGVANAWIPIKADKRRVYHNCPDYCVDGINNSEGSVDYFTSFCYSDPIETHKKLCTNETCLRKCCKNGYSIDKNRYSCVQDPNSTFTPSTDRELNYYNIVTGYPLCAPLSKVEEKFSVDREGNLILKDREFTSTDFCVDTFLDNEQRHQSALACLTETSLWSKVRPYLFPVCNVISLIFLMIIIVCHLLVPRLLSNGGLHQLCHVIALSIAYATNFSVNVFHEKLLDDVCVDLAIALQFGFLATFFWLNVMCFEIWRKIRILKSYRPCKSYPNKYYMMYGWGIPLLICVTTILMQKNAPDNVWGVIKPYIGVSRCWFREDIGHLIYFYGPIAVLFLFNSGFLILTYINYKIMLRKYEEAANDLKELGAGVIRKQRIKTSCMPSRQINDHVHDFNQKLKIFILTATCWVTEILSWKIPPLEIWALTDTLNSLQGFFLFTILLSNSNKRKHLKKKFPRLFLWLEKSNKFPAKMKKWLQNNVNCTILPTSFLTSSISSQFSNSSVFRTITTSVRSSNPPSSSSSFYVQSSVSFDIPDDGVIGLSHSSLPGSDSIQSPPDPSLRSSKSPEVTQDSSF
ncbi:G-protein coupled receptor Mth2-like [Palaemon carinicauda]|uniref:G-protein coupled receptor Mth2-like n=1 Tax=Palaemon carinicauda TaxID=392227 RepID=UPI0035B58D34